MARGRRKWLPARRAHPQRFSGLYAGDQPARRSPAAGGNEYAARGGPANPGNTIAVDHDWYEEHIVAHADGQYSIDTAVINQLMAEAGNLIADGAPLKASSWKIGLKPIPGDGEPVVGELRRFPAVLLSSPIPAPRWHDPR